MDAPTERLVITCNQPGAVFRVTDGRSARVGTGMYRLELDLPRGLYTVSTLLGGSLASKTVLLDRSREVAIEVHHPSFGDLAFSLAPRILAAVPAPLFDSSGTTVVALRGPFRETPARRHLVSIERDGRDVAAAAQDHITTQSGVWTWQLFRVPAGKSAGLAAGVRSVDGVRTCHAIPQLRGQMVWMAYPAPKDAAAEGATLPPAHYVRLRLTAPGAAPEMELQSLSDQVFTTLASRGTLPFSPPVLERLFAEDADPLLALAAAHVISMRLGWYGLLEKLPQDEGGEAARAPEGAAATAQEPVPLPSLIEQIHGWLKRCDDVLDDCPDSVAIRYLYQVAKDTHVARPPVLLRSLDALIKAEQDTRDPRIVLCDAVWKSRFQVSDSFAFLQWDADARKAEAKRLAQVEQSFVLSQALERSVQALQAVMPAPAAAQLRAGETPEMGVPDEAPRAAAPMPESGVEQLVQRARGAVEHGRSHATEVLAGRVKAKTRLAAASSELTEYLRLNAQALRVPSYGVTSLAQRLLKKRSTTK